ncbi:MAG: DUF3990 domain-containing protein [Eubacterium sp.]|nr:DUF3990 domain-containing protein [Eubacterium sp.]MBR7061071.1 DUF3990 domain-containing protein [Eubacterium sp.]
MKLYHASALELRNPDINFGRKNADFGGGFYLSDSLEFAKKWANERKNCVNFYSLDLTGLSVKRLERNKEWFEYIANNRSGNSDLFKGADVVIGPIANDTLFDTYGIIFSGLISDEDALELLKTGKQFCQINVKSEKAAKNLKWEKCEILDEQELLNSKKNLAKESREFREAFESAIRKLKNYDEINEILS